MQYDESMSFLLRGNQAKLARVTLVQQSELVHMRLRKSIFHLLLAFVFVAITCNSASAGQILSQGFGSNAIVQDFTNLGSVSNPFAIDGITYSTGDSIFRYYAHSPLLSFGDSIGTNENDLGFIDVTLQAPVLRAGGWIGASDSHVEFFDETDTLIGDINISYNDTPTFAGWQSGDSLIKHIRFTDTQQNGMILILDRFTTEQSIATVPEPTTLIHVMFALSLFLSFGLMRHRRSPKGGYSGPQIVDSSGPWICYGPPPVGRPEIPAR